MNPENITKEEFHEADGKIENTGQFQAASKQLVQERKDEARAVAEFPNYEELDGVKFYAPTAKHKWALAAFAQGDNDVIKVMIGGYILGTLANNLSKIFIEDKNGTLEVKALAFTGKFDIEELSWLVVKLCEQGDSETESEDSEEDSKN